MDAYPITNKIRKNLAGLAVEISEGIYEKISRRDLVEVFFPDIYADDVERVENLLHDVVVEELTIFIAKRKQEYGI